MKFEDLTPEQMEKARACKTPEDIVALAKEEGYELSDEELKSISGSVDTDWVCMTVVTCKGFCKGHAPFVP